MIGGGVTLFRRVIPLSGTPAERDSSLHFSGVTPPPLSGGPRSAGDIVVASIAEGPVPRSAGSPAKRGGG